MVKKTPKNGSERVPAFLFYPLDWLNDRALSMCSNNAKGIWIGMLCLMHEGDVYGKMIFKGKKPTEENIARSINSFYEEYVAGRDELIGSTVLRIDGNGVYYSKRMVREGEIKKIRATVGYTGGKKTQENISFAKAKSEANINFGCDFAKANVEANAQAKFKQDAEDEDEYDNSIFSNKNTSKTNKSKIPYKEKTDKFDSQFKQFTKEEFIQILTEKLHWNVLDWKEVFLSAFNCHPETKILELAIMHMIITGIDPKYRSTNPKTQIIKLLVDGNITLLSKNEFENSLYGKLQGYSQKPQKEVLPPGYVRYGSFVIHEKDCIKATIDRMDAEAEKKKKEYGEIARERKEEQDAIDREREELGDLPF